MSQPPRIEFTALAAEHIRDAERWWRLNRPAAPNAIREELQRLLPVIALQPHIGSRATNLRLEGVRRIYIPRVRGPAWPSRLWSRGVGQTQLSTKGNDGRPEVHPKWFVTSTAMVREQDDRVMNDFR